MYKKYLVKSIFKKYLPLCQDTFQECLEDTLFCQWPRSVLISRLKTKPIWDYCCVMIVLGTCWSDRRKTSSPVSTRPPASASASAAAATTTKTSDNRTSPADNVQCWTDSTARGGIPACRVRSKTAPLWTGAVARTVRHTGQDLVPEQTRQGQTYRESSHGSTHQVTAAVIIYTTQRFRILITQNMIAMIQLLQWKLIQLITIIMRLLCSVVRPSIRQSVHPLVKSRFVRISHYLKNMRSQKVHLIQ